MGKKKYGEEIEHLFKKSPVITFNSIERIIKNKKKKSQYAKQCIRNLIKTGKIKKITKGHYTHHDDPSLAVFCLTPAYLGLQDAVSFHGLWEQETIPVIVTSQRVRQGIRIIMGMNVMVRRIDKKYVFGFEYYEQNGVYYPYSDIEKTFIDMVYFRQPIDTETMENFREKMDRGKLKKYLARYPKRMRERIMKKADRMKK